MKKNFLTFLLLIFAIVLSAQERRQSIGVAVGSIDGLSYKCFGKKNQHFAFQFDAYWQYGYLPKGTRIDRTIFGAFKSYTTQTFVSNSPSSLYRAVMTSYSFMYQGDIHSNMKGMWNWHLGAGFAFGMCWGDELDVMTKELGSNKKFRPWLKVDYHLIGGVEYKFAEIPLALGIDLRPGMTSDFYFKGLGTNRNDIYLLTFGWGVNMTVRYCFSKHCH